MPLFSKTAASDDKDSRAEVVPADAELGRTYSRRHSGVHHTKDLDLLEHKHLRIEDADPKVVRRILWKIDLVIMPPLMLTYFFQFLDKTSISYANLFDFQEKTHMKGQEFAWLGSLFYLGYLAWQPIAAWLLVRTNIRWHFGICIILWSACLGFMALCKNFAGLAACRFFLGCTESAMLPICGTITGMWYKREEQPVRVGIWYGCVCIAQIFGGLISYGMFELNSTVIDKWQFIFVLLGPVTAVFGIYVLCVIPASPATAWFLTPEERVLALERIRSNKTGTNGDGSIQWYQVREALLDPRIYLAALSVFAASVPNGGITSFGAVLVAGFGFDKKEASLLGMCTGASEIVGFAICITLAHKIGMRSPPAIFGVIVGIIGAGIMLGLPDHNKIGRMVGYCLTYWFAIGMLMFIPWMQSMVAGSTKRATFYALYQIFYAAGNLSGSQVFRAKDAPKYIPARIAVLVCLVAHVLTMGSITLLHKRWNVVRDRMPPEEEEENIEFKDYTDKQIPSFRYPY